MNSKNLSITFAIVAAVLYALSIPANKLFVSDMSPYSIATFLYLGAGVGVLIMRLGRRSAGEPVIGKFSSAELTFVVAMVVLDIAAPLLLLFGLQRSAAANASLLNNFEIVATSLIALVFFSEKISRRLWIAIALITAASAIMSMSDVGASFSFSLGSLMVIGACVCWGIENNCTRMLSNRPSSEIVIIKGFGAGLGAGIIALMVEGHLDVSWMIAVVFVVGFVCYGLSIDFYIRAQRHLGAAKTSAFYASSPFFGVLLSFVLVREPVESMFWPGLTLMAIATYFLITDEIGVQHTHEHTHTVVAEHTHPDGLTHTHEITVTHKHYHAHRVDETHGVDEFTKHEHTHDFSNEELSAHAH